MHDVTIKTIAVEQGNLLVPVESALRRQPLTKRWPPISPTRGAASRPLGQPEVPLGVGQENTQNELAGSAETKAVKQARQRGVKFDVGHGNQSFVLRNAAPAIAQGFWPDTISTDLHGLSMNAPMMDMPTLLSKFLALGMPLKEIMLRATWNPAQVIHRTELGHLSVGAGADIAVWNILRGQFGYGDASGGRIPASERIVCEMTIRNGEIAWDWNARASQDYKKLPPDYGLRPGIDHIIPPK